MTISTTASAVVLGGNGSTSVFTYSFICDAASTLQVIYTDTAGVQTTLTSSQYNVALNAPAAGSLHSVGGTVTYPTSGPAIANGTTLTISRTVPLVQSTSVSNQGDFYPTVVESALDNLCLEIQQVSGRTGQNRGTWTTGIAYNFGDVVIDGANGANTLNYYMCAIANTSGVWATDLAAGDWSLAINVAGIIASAAAAAASATAAAASATTATAQAVIATTQAGVATTQATNAAASALSAAGSATTATTQATNASTSATSAATSATSATASASSATSSASSATTSASSASTSATNAATSATAAAASAVAAGSTLTATSTTSNTIGTGNFTFTTQANKNFIAGQPIIAASAANTANYIHGTVFSYSGTTLVIAETDLGGSGAHADWNIAASGTQGTGTTTSVGLSAPAEFTVSGSPVTTTGTLTFTKATQTANLVYAGPTSGGAAAPTFRAHVAADFPAGTVSLTSLAVQAADTFLANATSGSASPTAVALAASQLAGRGASGDIAAIVLGTNLSMSGTTLNASSGSELVLLGTATASASATLDFTSLITSAYDDYLFVVKDLVRSATGASFTMFISIDNGSTWTPNIVYESASWPLNSTGPTYSGANTSPAALVNTGNTGQYNGTIVITNPLTTNKSASLVVEVTDGNTYISGRGYFNTSSAVNAIRFAPSSGNFTSGKVYLYGIKNT